MSVSLLAAYEAASSQSAILSAWFEDAPQQFLADVDDLLNVDIFVPEAEEALFFDDGPAPAAMLQIEAANAATLQELLDAEIFKELFLEEPGRRVPGLKAGFGLFETVSVPVFGQSEPAPRSAPMSFVVRYYGPMADQTAFHAFYVANHLPLLAKFPGIRNAFAYLPIAWRNPGLPESQVLLGNEVVFDSVRALNDALKSDVIVELRNDSRQFPPFGHSTHHAMRRRALSR
ncbi:MAG: EthD family reductase [Fimbriimonadaceae bacterium]|nr:EthD family reductase [Alphaproteobacteria bacterium]